MSDSGAARPSPTGDVFAAIGDPVRRKVLELVAQRGPVTATALAAPIDISRQGVAKHLDVLHAAGLVTRERAGRETRYTASLAALGDVTGWIARAEQQWDDRLGRLAIQVEARKDRT